MQKTAIEWVKNPDGSQGYTWNPITGCLNGCEYCYARKLANTRLKETYLANEEYAPLMDFSNMDMLDPADDPFYPRFWEDRLYHAWGGKPKGIFVCDMSDLFGIGIPEEWTTEILNLCRLHYENRYYLLTKQPQNLQKFSPFPDNCFVGVTATNRERFVSACTDLEHIWAKVKYLSLEPLLDWHDGGGVDIKGYLQNGGINWLIIGAQTKPTVYPKPEWVKEIVEAADRAGVAVFLKDSLSNLIPINSPLRYGPAGELRLRQEMPK